MITNWSSITCKSSRRNPSGQVRLPETHNSLNTRIRYTSQASSIDSVCIGGTESNGHEMKWSKWKQSMDSNRTWNPFQGAGSAKEITRRCRSSWPRDKTAYGRACSENHGPGPSWARWSNRAPVDRDVRPMHGGMKQKSSLYQFRGEISVLGKV